MLDVADLVGGGGGDGAEEVRLHLPRVLERHARDGGLVAARLVVEGGRRLAREAAKELRGLPAEQRREPLEHLELVLLRLHLRHDDFGARLRVEAHADAVDL